MSDKNSHSVAELNKRVQLLEKALLHERKKNQQLSNKLEQHSETEFAKHEALINSYEQAKSRQTQLQFLSLLSQTFFYDTGIDELFDDFSRQLSVLLDNCPVINISFIANNEKNLLVQKAPGQAWQTKCWNNNYRQLVEAMLQKERGVWHRLNLEKLTTDNDFTTLFHHQTLLYLCLDIDDTNTRMLCLDLSHFCYHDDFKETLNMAGKQFTQVVQRRLTEAELSYNYQVQQKTLAQLKATQKQLIHNEKMASLGQLAAGVAHEINNPIGYVTSNLDVLRSYIESYEQVINCLPAQNLKKLVSPQFQAVRADINDLIDACITGVDRVAEIVLSLKSFSRKEELVYEDVNLNEVIAAALKIVWNKLKYDYQVSQNLQDNLPAIKGVAGQIQQVLVNLFINAVQAMPENGELSIETKVGVDKNSVEVLVSDTGCGIDSHVQKNIFDPFFTTKGQNEGTGLGLSVSYAIMEKHNGVILVDSAPGKGTTFTLRFSL